MNIRKLPIATCVLIALNVFGFIAELIEGETEMAYRFAMYQGASQDGEWLRLVMNAFLHFGFPHLAVNMLCLFAYGMSLEHRIGPWKFCVIYFAAVLGGGLLINFAGGLYGLHMGASSAIWGLMTAMLMYTIKHKGNPIYALRGIVLNLIYSFTSGVSWQGHIGGGIGGLVAAFILFEL